MSKSTFFCYYYKYIICGKSLQYIGLMVMDILKDQNTIGLLNKHFKAYKWVLVFCQENL